MGEMLLLVNINEDLVNFLFSCSFIYHHIIMVKTDFPML